MMKNPSVLVVMVVKPNLSLIHVSAVQKKSFWLFEPYSILRIQPKSLNSRKVQVVLGTKKADKK